MIAGILLREANRLSLKIRAREGKLFVTPAKRCPPEFADLLRHHKRELLDLLQAKADGLAPDCAPWLHIAKPVLAGEFESADSSTRESLSIGLRSIAHPTCQTAL